MYAGRLLLKLVILTVTWSFVRCAAISYTWGHWSRWSTCDGTCPSTFGHMTRTRNCTHVVTIGNSTTTLLTTNRHCDTQGAPIDNSTCILHSCPVDGHWGSWGSWGSCSVTMGTGQSTRYRACNNPSPRYGGLSCPGASTDVAECSENVWSTWQTWSSCSVSCGNGTITRRRTCVNGTMCHDNVPGYGYVEASGCTKASCPMPIDGGWSNWTHADHCSATCDYGVAYATRTCTHPPPQHGGMDCQGPSSSFEKCTVRECYADGHWSKWTELTPCEAICGTGLQRTLRTCTDPAPRGGGKDCEGLNILSRECNATACPSDIKVCDVVRVKEAMSTVTVPDFSCGNTVGSEGLLIDLCFAPSTSNWILGALVRENCAHLPLYSPVASVDDPTGIEHGILLDCYQDVLTLGTLDCGGNIQQRKHDLRNNRTVYHIVTW